MRKLILTASVASSLLLSGASIAAPGSSIKFYGGASALGNQVNTTKTHVFGYANSENSNIEGTSTSTKSKDTGFGSYGAFGGFRVQNFGAELGYTKLRTLRDSYSASIQVDDNTVDGNIGLATRSRNIYADVLGYYSIPSVKGLDLIGSLGFGNIKSTVSAEAKATITTENGETAQVDAPEVIEDSHAKWAPRVGVGAQYMFTENLGGRAMYNYQKGNDIIKSNNAIQFSLLAQF